MHYSSYRGSLNFLDTARVRGGLAEPLSGVEASGQLLHVLCLGRLVHVAEGHVAEHQQSRVVGSIR